MRTDQETKRELFERITQLESAVETAGGTAAAGSQSGGWQAADGAETSPSRTPVSASALPPASPSELGSQLTAERQRTADLQKVCYCRTNAVCISISQVLIGHARSC